MVQVRLAEMQDASAKALAESTGNLVKTTARLVQATWGLVGATGLLVLAEIFLKHWSK